MLCGEHAPTLDQESATLLQKLSVQTSLVLWARVMASLHWAVQCYCRITERLIETNDSNNGTLSPQAGFVVSLISVAAKAMRTSHHPDPSKGSCQGSFKVANMRLSCSRCVKVLRVLLKHCWLTCTVNHCLD